MKILDRYIAKNFLIGYFITFCVLIGLVLMIDLFVNISEFAEHADLGAGAVMRNIVEYYSSQITLWFRDLAGMITVVAATFSLARLTYNNELVAVMASGVSLKRVMAPIIFLAFCLTGLLVFDQEVAIPRLAPQLVRSHDALPGQRTYNLWFMTDADGALICTERFDENTQTMYKPTIILREPKNEVVFRVTGWIRADEAVYNPETKRWDLKNGVIQRIVQEAGQEEVMVAEHRAVAFETDITPQDIPLRQQEDYKALLSSAQLAELARKRGTRVRDQAEFYLHKHSRITKPIINMVMLLVALPVLVCRDPKRLKSAIMSSFGITGACFVVTFVCEMMATEVFFDRIRPELWAWAPVFIFLPIAIIEIDGMKT
ncbi:MAG TPA: LptF/LptG family permease [Anaerohalosphaeraceae bacterium]|jgi:lipopolysaccharide export system permease protein|nr:LptF/LptG family permease [Anaerohalosphaeraceae bacterium]HRT51522.1 LptF/LptG family permease [Anaerohalosphaeraceae bacterium]HRT87550.1 LptF/LptG family permease [Anaerohalosphaeraceae bacterium]